MMSIDPAGDSDLSDLLFRNKCVCVELLPEAGGWSHMLGFAREEADLSSFGRLGLLTHGGGGCGGQGSFGTWDLEVPAAAQVRAACSILFYHTTGVYCVPHTPQAQSRVGHTEMTGTPGQEARSLVRKGLR